MSELDVWLRRAKKLRDHPRRGRFLMSRVLWQAGLSSRFVATLPDGLRVRFYPSSVSAALWIDAAARGEDAEFLRLVLAPGETYIDCGANIGHLALIARQVVGATGSVTAIEANPRIFGYCVGNLRLNDFGDVLALNVALGEQRGTIEISDRRDDDQNRVAEGGVRVAMRPLDELIGAPHVTLLKIDVEGYELPVLRGAQQTLAKTDVVYCELSTANSARFGHEPREVEDVLLAAGFQLARREGTRWLVAPGRVFDTLADADIPRTGYNLIAIRPAVLPALEAKVAPHGHTIVRP